MPSFTDPFELAGLELANRVVMAPLTRCHANGPGNSPTALMAAYYAQRAGAGLIIAEATHPSVVGQGFPDEPGLHTAEQVEGWRKVTDAVHAEGGKIFCTPDGWPPSTCSVRGCVRWRPRPFRRAVDGRPTEPR
jgi:N-ethylmaleimide reductase